MPSVARTAVRATLGTFHDREGETAFASGDGAFKAGWARLFGGSYKQSWSGDVSPGLQRHRARRAGRPAIARAGAWQRREGPGRAFLRLRVGERQRHGLRARPAGHAGRQHRHQRLQRRRLLDAFLAGWRLSRRRADGVVAHGLDPVVAQRGDQCLRPHGHGIARARLSHPLRRDLGDRAAGPGHPPALEWRCHAGHVLQRLQLAKTTSSPPASGCASPTPSSPTR